ncbi:uncharacterized protein LOC142180071 [Nicotiana tabacum]|uniref:Uncharacterized protein LOC142180071 n=1 Tax=Nicotiana tabacum TaxID=4097 RepID=A0AC58UC78_TOBAC
MSGVEFEGTVDPTDVEQWLERIERVFEQLECSEAAKFKKASGACFNCGSFDHKVKDCPNPNLISSPCTKGLSLLLKGIEVRNLEITKREVLVELIKPVDQELQHELMLRDRGMTKMGQTWSLVVCTQIYRGCPFMIQNLGFHAALIEMPFQDYDVIIRMDWLHRYHAVVVCRSKRVTFKAPTFSHIVIQGERSLTSNIISTIVVRKMISQGCEAYISHIVDTHLESPRLKDIPVVCEFCDVFPENLSGLPWKEKLNFL